MGCQGQKHKKNERSNAGQAILLYKSMGFYTSSADPLNLGMDMRELHTQPRIQDKVLTFPARSCDTPYIRFSLLCYHACCVLLDSRRLLRHRNHFVQPITPFLKNLAHFSFPHMPCLWLPHDIMLALWSSKWRSEFGYILPYH